MDKLHINTLKILQFKLMHVLACIEIKYVLKVLPLIRLEEVPLSPIYVAGLMNFAGKSIQTVDLAMMLGMQRTQSYSLDMPILLCTNSTMELALIVDSIQGLETASPSQLQIRDVISNAASPFIGTITNESKQSLLIDMDRIFIQCNSRLNVKNEDNSIPNMDSCK